MRQAMIGAMINRRSTQTPLTAWAIDELSDCKRSWARFPRTLALSTSSALNGLVT